MKYAADSTVRNWGRGRQRPDGGAENLSANGRAGWSLLELVIALSVMLVAFGGVTAAALRASSQKQEASQALIATDQALEIVSELQSVPLDEVFARYNADPLDDPKGEGTAPGAEFRVLGLQGAEGHADGLGRIEFPGNGPLLLESVKDPGLGMPRDLNGDGDAEDATLDYTVLPVRVRVTWRGPSGPREITMVTILYEL